MEIDLHTKEAVEDVGEATAIFAHDAIREPSGFCNNLDKQDMYRQRYSSGGKGSPEEGGRAEHTDISSFSLSLLLLVFAVRNNTQIHKQQRTRMSQPPSTTTLSFNLADKDEGGGGRMDIKLTRTPRYEPVYKILLADKEDPRHRDCLCVDYFTHQYYFHACSACGNYVADDSLSKIWMTAKGRVEPCVCPTVTNTVLEKKDAGSDRLVLDTAEEMKQHTINRHQDAIPLAPSEPPHKETNSNVEEEARDDVDSDDDDFCTGCDNVNVCLDCNRHTGLTEDCHYLMRTRGHYNEELCACATEDISERLLNYTPHDVCIFDKSGRTLCYTIPSRGVARLQEAITSMEHPLSKSIEITTKTYTETYGLPASKQGVYLIVSDLVRTSNDHRLDLLSPDTGPYSAVRASATASDRGGQILGVRGLISNKQK